jgi:hypothetical protein
LSGKSQDEISNRLAAIEFARREEEVERRGEESEARKRADVRIQELPVVQHGSGMTNEQQLLTLHNHGPATARGVLIELLGTIPDQNPAAGVKVVVSRAVDVTVCLPP